MASAQHPRRLTDEDQRSAWPERILCVLFGVAFGIVAGILFSFSPDSNRASRIAELEQQLAEQMEATARASKTDDIVAVSQPSIEPLPIVENQQRPSALPIKFNQITTAIGSVYTTEVEEIQGGVQIVLPKVDVVVEVHGNHNRVESIAVFCSRDLMGMADFGRVIGMLGRELGIDQEQLAEWFAGAIQKVEQGFVIGSSRDGVGITMATTTLRDVEVVLVQFQPAQ